jgi:tRNA modification GTPase
MNTDETIAAVSTPPGEGAIAIVRISGAQAIPIADGLFRGKQKLPGMVSRTLHHGRLVDPRDDEVVDEVMVAVMRAPDTFTGEDIVEINCHGGLLLTRRILELVVRGGARLAEPGEFTRRAFLNGRLDLLQAEAVADVIRSRADRSLKMAQQQLGGGLSDKINGLKEALVTALSLVEAELDFSDREFFEQDLCDQERTDRHPVGGYRPAGAGEQILAAMDAARKGLSGLLSGARFGRQLRDGFGVVLVGRPNVGKSSLFNALLQEDRAIVMPAPGTTRDTISEQASLNGLPVRLVDTAGLHAADGQVEKEGVRRTRQQMESADLLVIVLDASERAQPEDRRILEETDHSKGLVVVNKIDLPERLNREGLEGLISQRRTVRTSAVRGDGIEEVGRAIGRELFNGQGPDLSEPLVTSLRHQEALERSADMIQKARQRLTSGGHQELVAEELRGAIGSLEEIIGGRYSEEVLDRIFSQFCIGK